MALDVLDRIEGEDAYANLVLPAALERSGLDERDRRFVTDLVYGTTRMRRACDFLVDRFMAKPPAGRARNALRLGAYQIVFAGVPAHAAVAETVAVSPQSVRGLVNAVLRRVADQGTPDWPDDAIRLSVPDWILERLAADLGRDRAVAALAAMDARAAAVERPDGYVQDPASQQVAAAVGALPGELVLDVCAAPGGKATALATTLGRAPSTVTGAAGQAGPGHEAPDSVDGGPDPSVVAGANPAGLPGAGREAPGPVGGGEGAVGGSDPSAGGGVLPETAGVGRVVAMDVRERRAGLVRGNAVRLGLDDRMDVVVADGTRPPLRPGTFDRVLVDAPCSGLGTLRRRPDLRWRAEPDSVRQLARLQRRLLDAAADLVRPGGLLVYSVCTLTRAETTGVDDWLAAHRPDLVPVPTGAGDPAPGWEPWGRGAILLPQTQGTDGMCLFRYTRSRS